MIQMAKLTLERYEKLEVFIFYSEGVTVMIGCQFHVLLRCWSKNDLRRIPKLLHWSTSWIYNNADIFSQLPARRPISLIHDYDVMLT